ncbi:MAG: DegV family protein [Acidimicrobiales bacterium]
MARVRVVTDSACDLTDRLAGDNGIVIVPLSIRFGDEELVDRRDLDAAEFWKRCASSHALPETSAPPPGAFQGVFERARDDGCDAVVCVTISAELSSGTHQSAQTAADAMGDFDVRVVDTRTVTMGQGLVALAAAESAGAGADADTVTKLTSEVAQRTRVYGVLGSLEHLQRGGRIGAAQALLGSMLSIKPVIQVTEGIVREESKQRTRSKSLEYLAGKLRAEAPFERLAVCDGAANDLDRFVGLLEGIEIRRGGLITVDLGAVVGTHAGPGTIGVCVELPA